MPTSITREGFLAELERSRFNGLLKTDVKANLVEAIKNADSENLARVYAQFREQENKLIQAEEEEKKKEEKELTKIEELKKMKEEDKLDQIRSAEQAQKLIEELDNQPVVVTQKKKTRFTWQLLAMLLLAIAGVAVYKIYINP